MEEKVITEDEVREMNRKLRKLGQSIGITFPLEFAKILNLEADEDVKIGMNFKDKIIHIVLDTQKRVNYPDVFLKYEDGRYQLWNRLIMQEEINKVLAYSEKVKLKHAIKELNDQKYFVIWL